MTNTCVPVPDYMLYMWSPRPCQPPPHPVVWWKYLTKTHVHTMVALLWTLSGKLYLAVCELNVLLQVSARAHNIV